MNFNLCFFVGSLTPASWMLTNSQHVMPAGLATQEDAVKSEKTDEKIKHFKYFEDSGDVVSMHYNLW